MSNFATRLKINKRINKNKEMKVSFENSDKVNGKMTIVIEEEDFAKDVEKTLKDYRKRANIPGFRPGQAPMGMIKRQFGASIKMDAVNKVVGDNLYKYVQDNKIQMLGQPLPSKEQEPQDLEKNAPYTFNFDIAIAPEFKAELTEKDKIDYYKITVDDTLIDRQVDMFAQRAGKYDKVNDYKDNDMLKGDIRELNADGSTKYGGVTVEGAVMMPSYIKVDDQKKLFDGAKLGDIITFNPRKAYPENDTEISSLLKIEKKDVAEHTGDFSYQITEISRFSKAEVNQELFDGIYGKDTVKSEVDFRKKISEGMAEQFVTDSDYKFLLDLRTYMEKKIGKLQFPDELLKRVMLQGNKDRDEKFVDEHYDESLKQLQWQLIRDQLVAANKIKVEEADVKNTAKEQARVQFAQYGMQNVPEEYLENYANELMKKQENINSFVDQTIDIKLVAAVKKIVKLNEKPISLDDFNKLVEVK